MNKQPGEIAAKIGADVEKSKRAARLAKADLTTGVVGEFPELQGVMGRYYALHDKEDAPVADAIRDHYKPVGPSDAVPSDKVVRRRRALADKLDALTGFSRPAKNRPAPAIPSRCAAPRWASSSILLENRLQFSAWTCHPNLLADEDEGKKKEKTPEKKTPFFADRLKVALKEKGIRHDLIDAVFSLGNEDDLVRLVARVEALQSFLKTDDGVNLLAGYKRAANILKAEEKKDGQDLYLRSRCQAADRTGRKSAACRAGKSHRRHWARRWTRKILPQPCSRWRRCAFRWMRFFQIREGECRRSDKLRANRLHLLAGLEAALHRVADFSKIEG